MSPAVYPAWVMTAKLLCCVASVAVCTIVALPARWSTEAFEGVSSRHILAASAGVSFSKHFYDVVYDDWYLRTARTRPALDVSPLYALACASGGMQAACFVAVALVAMAVLSHRGWAKSAGFVALCLLPLSSAPPLRFLVVGSLLREACRTGQLVIASMLLQQAVEVAVVLAVVASATG
jgi:hypothetical protein